MAEKRERFQSPPTGRTPARRPKRQALRQTEGSAVLHEPRVLSLRNESTAQPGGPANPTPIAGTQRPSSWSDEESKALLEFLLFHRPSDVAINQEPAVLGVCCRVCGAKGKGENEAFR